MAGAKAVARAESWLDEFVSSIAPGKPLSAQLAAQLQRLSGASLRSFMAESRVGSYPLEVIATSGAPTDGATTDVAPAVSAPGPGASAAPAFVGGERL